MFVVHSYPLAVVCCVLTMLCWGSWATTRKLARPDWRFELFYWDYTLGVLLITLAFGLTLGSAGTEGRAFILDLSQASTASLVAALLAAPFSISATFSSSPRSRLRAWRSHFRWGSDSR